MGRSNLDRSQYCISIKMTKLTILLLGVLTIATLAAAWENEDSSSLSEEMVASRQVRSPQRKIRKTKGKPRKPMKKTMKKGIRKSGKAKKTMKKGTRVQKKGTRVQKKGTRVQKKGTRKVAKKQMKPKTQKKATKKVTKPKGTKTSKPETRQVADADTCYYKSIKAMRMLAGIVANFEKQQNRMKAHSKIASGKLDKKDAFESINQKLIEAGGGNKSALTCSGSSTNPGAAQLTNLTTVLGECQTVLATSCNMSLIPQPNNTQLDACNASIVAFKAEAEKCLDLSIKEKSMSAAVCECWTSTAIDELFESNTDCKFPEETRNITAAKNKCVEEFGKCRKYEDDASISITACASSSSALVEKVAALTENAAAVDSAKTAVQALANTARRTRRSDSLSSCTEVETTATALTSMVLVSPSSTEILVLSAQITSTTVTCTTEEAASLAALDALFEEAANILVEAIDSVQEQLLALTGTTASTEVIENFSTESPTMETTMMF